MAYYQELTEDLRDEVWNILTNKVKNDKNHRANAKHAGMTLDDYTQETIDDWVNCHNSDSSNAEWLRQANEADI